jgi:hypothetical protein
MIPRRRLWSEGDVYLIGWTTANGGEMVVSRDKWTMDKHFRTRPGAGEERHMAHCGSFQFFASPLTSQAATGMIPATTKTHHDHQGCAAAERRDDTIRRQDCEWSGHVALRVRPVDERCQWSPTAVFRKPSSKPPYVVKSTGSAKNGSAEQARQDEGFLPSKCGPSLSGNVASIPRTNDAVLSINCPSRGNLVESDPPAHQKQHTVRAAQSRVHMTLSYIKLINCSRPTERHPERFLCLAPVPGPRVV